jgi:hypothetical protein
MGYLKYNVAPLMVPLMAPLMVPFNGPFLINLVE